LGELAALKFFILITESLAAALFRDYIFSNSCNEVKKEYYDKKPERT
jgi:hypothetical protein